MEARSGPARAGRLITPHGEVQTPVFMPVGTLASVKGVPQETLEELGVELVLANTYHLYLRPGCEVVRQTGGLHGFMGWRRALLTDSGGYQVFSLNELRKLSGEGVEFRSHLDGSTHFFTPESATAAQIALGADIIMAFDECTEFPADKRRARESMELTLRWAERCKRYFDEHKGEVPWGDVVCGESRAAEQGIGVPRLRTPSSATPSSFARDDKQRRLAQDDGSSLSGASQALFGIVQGGMHAELRRESAERTVGIGFDGYAIGGLSVGEPRTATREMVEATLPFLPADKPRYLMGVGTPEEITAYARLGIDMMDCVLPTRAARHGLLYTSEGKVQIKSARYARDQGPIDARCGCRVCARYSRAYLRHLYASGEPLAAALNTVHNLAFYLDTMRRVRHAIKLGDLAGFPSGDCTTA
ncbi:MAG TPA: tRNA guanosine(34) transglycosylase Tgt [Terriglobales bacterium]|nr:tRNA guanosine(34) transglycosylase Tgt [Terriglobales bacterium]